VNTLFEWRNHKQITSTNGENGRTAKETGKGGNDTYINVPLGTSVYDLNTDELLCDILESGQTFLICEGGKGGRGNAFFKSSFNRAPTLHENGDLGQEKKVKFKLRYIADVCLIGLPNAGKSTFVGKISNAKPKVANYQFTTLVPVLGVVNINKDNLVFADMPGLIKGASEGKGLGHEFLKHIERCQIFIHLISMSDSDNEDVVKAYETINNEIMKYNRELVNKPIIVVANKKDIDGSEDNFLKLNKKLGKSKIAFISSKNGDGIKEVLDEVYKKYLEVKKINELKIKNQKQNVKVIEIKKQKDFSHDLEVLKIIEGV
jgi:GTP-binding protein